jgi:hypothetical protein
MLAVFLSCTNFSGNTSSQFRFYCKMGKLGAKMNGTKIYAAVIHELAHLPPPPSLKEKQTTK